MKKVLTYILLFIPVALLLSGCADAVQVDKVVTTNPYGFLNGLWHGLIVPVSFVGSLFNDEIAIYGANNVGGWYDLGFVIGLIIIFGGSSGSACSKKKKDR